jgi:hypothetical protein
MTVNIREILSRRTDLSTFLVHLTRDRDEEWPAKRALMKIAEDTMILAKTPMGWAADHLGEEVNAKRSQRVVSFSETPLEHIDLLVADIEGRQVKLRPWGLVVTKMMARNQGVNPVWYVDMTTGRDWEIANALNALRDEAIAGGFAGHPASMIFPYFEPMGTWPNRQREFWWEREWRIRGHFSFRLDQIVSWIVPQAEQEEFIHTVNDWYPGSPCRCIDANWSLEEIIAKLTDQSPISPFE